MRTRQPTRFRRVYEWAQAVATAFEWPARTVEALGLLPTLRIDYRSIALSASPTRTVRIGFASDFHAGPTTPTPHIHRALAQLAALEPDAVLLGGDFVSIRPEYADRVVGGLGALGGRCPIYAVLGNHDYYAGGDGVTERLARSGVRVLVNEGVTLPEPLGWVSLYGLDDHLLGLPEPPGPARAGLGDSPVRMVLMHAPSGLLDLGDYRFDLALAGHVHGGQISLPGGFPMVVPKGLLSRRFAHGYFELASGGRLLVSRGVGFTSLPIRLNADPEIHLLTISA